MLSNNIKFKKRKNIEFFSFQFQVFNMKVFFALLVILAVFGAFEARSSPKFREKINIRTPFYKRQRVHNPLIVGGSEGRIEDFPHHLGLIDISWGG